jgi:hypothetical protein
LFGGCGGVLGVWDRLGSVGPFGEKAVFSVYMPIW